MDYTKHENEDKMERILCKFSLSHTHTHPHPLIMLMLHTRNHFKQFSVDLSQDCKNPQLSNEVEQVIFHVPNVIAAASKRRDTPPHCIFAIDNLVRRAVNGLLTILIPGKVMWYQTNLCSCVGWKKLLTKQICVVWYWSFALKTQKFTALSVAC